MPTVYLAHGKQKAFCIRKTIPFLSIPVDMVPSMFVASLPSVI